MTRLKTIGVVLLALFAFSAVAATAAQAEEAPYWSIEGTRLAAGKTYEITGKAVTNQTLTSTLGQVITCTGLSLKEGAVLLGSNAGEPGRSDEVIIYKGCTVTGNGTKCAVQGGTVTTVPLSNELAYATNKKSVVVEFKPITGKTLAPVAFEAETGGKCTVNSVKVTGQVATEALTDAEPPVLLELGKGVTQAESWLLRAPTTAIRHIWLIAAGTGKEAEVEELAAFGGETTYAGTVLILLAEKGVSNKKLWSPLF